MDLGKKRLWIDLAHLTAVRLINPDLDEFAQMLQADLANAVALLEDAQSLADHLGWRIIRAAFNVTLYQGRELGGQGHVHSIIRLLDSFLDDHIVAEETVMGQAATVRAAIPQDARLLPVETALTVDSGAEEVRMGVLRGGGARVGLAIASVATCGRREAWI